MFGFGKKEKSEQPKKKSTIDKLIMGAIVGGAIGSVVGMNLAPKKGKETREYLTQKGKEIGSKIQNEISSTQKPGSRPKFFSRLKNKFFPKKEKKQPATLAQDVDLKKIPDESQ